MLQLNIHEMIEIKHFYAEKNDIFHIIIQISL